MKRTAVIFLFSLIIIGLIAVYFLWLKPSGASSRSRNLLAYLRDPQSHSEWEMEALQPCGDSPFVMPSSGYIGYLWDDSFLIGHRHQGIDIFGGGAPGEVPVYAAYEGYLTREKDWISTVIIRIPSDPLNPSEQIWNYYTHMAYESGESLIVSDFSPGTSEVFVKAGTLLGYQGNYSGSPGNPTGVHLHFSIVKDNGNGGYLNELEIGNTLDPSSYLGMRLNNKQEGITPVVCQN